MSTIEVNLSSSTSEKILINSNRKEGKLKSKQFKFQCVTLHILQHYLIGNLRPSNNSCLRTSVEVTTAGLPI